MIHIVQCDDPSLLPFARSRLGVLRGLGLAHISQKYDVGGVTVRVQKSGEHEYIWVSGGSSEMAMDSGIISVGAHLETNPARFLPGWRYSFPPYENNFTELVSGTAFYRNPGTTSEGQFAGVLRKGSRFTGKVRKDTVVESFACQTLAGPDGTRVTNEGDETLLSKKRAGIFCPASMFTGRARLYAQAMYGQHLYDRAKSGDDGEDVARPMPAWGESGIPTLALPIYIDPNTERRALAKENDDIAKAAYRAAGYLGEPPSIYNVTLNINSGVYFDPTSKKHWLINPGNESVTIYPLMSSSAGESMRGWIGSSSLSADDSKHLETFVLSACRPHVEVAVTIDTMPIAAYASGYGWHWNWSGTMADMVQVQSSRQFPYPTGAMESAHFRLTVTATYSPDSGETAWQASAAQLSGPTYWETQTTVCCVTHPNWTNRYIGEEVKHPPVYWSEKLPLPHDPTYGALRPLTAPIYCFYKGDELQLIEFSLQITDDIPGYAEASEGYIEMIPDGGPLDFFTYGNTIGNDPGYLHVTEEIEEEYKYTIKCNGVQVQVVRGGKKVGYAIDDGAKTEITSHGALEDNTYPTIVGTIILKSGRPIAPSTWAQEYPGRIDNGFGASTDHQGVVFNVVSEFQSISASTETMRYGTAGGVIPFYDAEAFYFVQDTWDEYREYARSANTHSGYWISEDSGKSLVPNGAGYDVVYHGWSRYEISASASFTEVYGPVADQTTVQAEQKALIGIFATGQANAAEPPVSTYGMFANSLSNYVEETFDTIASAGTEGHFRGLVEKNWPTGGALVNPVIVGWV